jgi:outer membrane receptor for ferrienterochelin and colicin
MKFNSEIRLPKKSLVVALGLLVAATAAYGQSTTSSIFGRAPVQAGESVVLSNGAGLTRTVGIDSQGRYNAAQLPVGTYSVTLMRDGKEVQRRDNVLLRVGIGVDISFSAEAAEGSTANATQLSGVNVTANAVPPIDVSSVDSRTVITAEQLARLPLPRTAEAAALLAPGAVTAAGGATSTTGEPLVSFGGSSSTENAYYINGFNSTDPFNAKGGIALPYGSIDQEEAYTGGYSAQYGRTDGGVINMIGKSGTNEWHFGAQYVYAPQDWRSGQDNTYYMNGLPPSPVAGRLYDPGRNDGYWNSTYDLYVGGPLIKDRLFVFASVEANDEGGYTVNNVDAGTSKHYKNNNPKWYAKVNWNINDSNLLELTGASEKDETTGSFYNYDYNAMGDKSFKAFASTTKLGGDMWSAKYTGYLTDSLTLNAMYGKMTTVNYSAPVGYNPNLTYISGATSQNPALNGGVPITNAQTLSQISNPGNKYKTSNLRLSLTYVLGSHTITAGIDNLRSNASDQGHITTGPGGYWWTYGHTDHPELPIAAKLGVGPLINYPNGAGGYYVTRNIDVSGAGLLTTQRAEYIEDNWQVSDRWLVSVGLRNDAFTNYNGSGQPYMRQTSPQWAPRLGFSWDVNGDGTFKVYGNVGRYYLGQPLAPGGVANGVLRTQQYFTYSSIAADGTPTGLTQVSVPVSANNFFGQAPDPRTLTAHNIKAQDQDEFILGFTKTAGPKWVYGAKFTRRMLRHNLDDYCNAQAVVDKAASMGITDVDDSTCYYINPGIANTFAVRDASGNYHDVTLSNKEIGFTHMVRRYYALEGFLEHPFDGQWYGKVSYTFSRSYGNTEGQGQSDIFAVGGIQNMDWDFPELMVYANGPQGNDHTHQLKAFGYYQINPEWLVSGNLSVMSGGPKYCLGLYGPNPLDTNTNDPDGYGSAYHWCNGQPSPPGAQGRLPWIKQVDLGVQYRPAFADHKLGFHLDVFNVFNSQAQLNLTQGLYSDRAGTLNPLYGTPRALQPPRYVRMSVTYDY